MIPRPPRSTRMTHSFPTRRSSDLLFGEKPTVADAMFAPVAQRFLSYAVALSAPSAAYCNWSNDWDLMREWIDAARREEDEVEELEVDRKSTRLNSSR